MTKNELVDRLEQAPIISAVKDARGLAACLSSDTQAAFVLYGNLLEIPQIVAQVHQTGKAAIVHLDLVEGLAPRDIAVDYIRAQTQADGIISTKSPLIRRAKGLGLLAIHRYFLLDSMALANIRKQLPAETADCIELIPGAMPQVLKQIAQESALPFIAGGLINTKEDILNALSAGALAVSTTNPDLWNI